MNEPRPESINTITLFFSERCPLSKKLIDKLRKNTELMKKTQSIPIEKYLASGNTLPPQIKTVPTVIINGKEIFQGKKAMEWVASNQELEAGPTWTSKGFDTSSFSSLKDDDNLSGGFEGASNFSLLDSVNGCDGIKISDDAASSQGSSTRGGDSMNMENLIAQRNQELKGVLK